MIGDILRNFSFTAQWNGGVLLFSLFAIVIYLFLLPTSKQHTWKKTTLFIMGIFLFALALGSPLNILARIIFRAHMIQMTLLFMVVAPLLVLGMKKEFFSNPSFLEKGLSSIKKPILSISIFHGLFMIYHIPVVFDYVRTTFTLNYFYLFLLFLASLLLWSSLFERVKPKQVTVLIVNILLFMTPAIIFVVLTESIYATYDDFDLLLSALELCLPAGESIETLPRDLLETLVPFPPLNEQRIGGVVLLASQVLWGIVPVMKN